jgi:cation-transporting ATPase I
MPLPSLLRIPRRLLGAAWQLTAAPAEVSSASAAATADVVVGTAQAGARGVRTVVTTGTSTAVAATTKSAEGAAKVVEGAVRLLGSALTDLDPAADGGFHRLTQAAGGMFQPSQRRNRRIWSSGGRVHVELAASAMEGGREARRALLRRLERLDGVDWATVNDIAGRVLVAFDDRRITVDDVVSVVAAIEKAHGGQEGFAERDEHPGDLEPLLAAVITVLVDSAAVGVAYLGKLLPVPALTRHATVTLSLLDAVPHVKRALTNRIGTIGTDLVFTGVSALLHAATQGPTVPALNAAAAAQRLLEVSARRAVWQCREPKLCRPELDNGSVERRMSIVERPTPLPPGPIESYQARLDPSALVSAVGLLALTRRPSRSADMMKSLTAKPATQGREAFAAVLDMLMCRRGVLPMDGSAYRRLDRIDAVVLDSDVLCTGPPMVVQAQGLAQGWDDQRVWSVASRLLGAPIDGDDKDDEGVDGLRLGRPQESPDLPGGRRHRLWNGREMVGTVTVVAELAPLAEAVVKAARSAVHRLVLTDHIGVRELTGLADEVTDAAEPLIETVCRLQAQGHGVLLVSAADDSGLLAADVGVAPTQPDRSPAWGADLVTEPGLGEVWRLLTAVPHARALSRRVVSMSLSGNVLGALLAAVGDPRSGQRAATTPTKTASMVTMAIGAWSALRLHSQPLPAATVHTPWHALEPQQVLRRLADLPTGPAQRPDSKHARLRSVSGLPMMSSSARLVRTFASELSDPLTPLLSTGAAATAILGGATDAVLVGSVMVGNALLSALQRLRAETTLESLLIAQEVLAHRDTDAGWQDVSATTLRVGDVVGVQSGDVVPADARLLEVLDLEVDESSLTGESLSVAKSLPATPGADLGDRTCMLFAGTTVVAGTGRAVVVAVGDATQAGRAAVAAATAAPRVGIQARLAELTEAVLPLTLAGGAAVTALGVLWRRPLREAVTAGVALAVAAVPEGLPLVATVAQQAAARRLSKRGGVVRSARVLEALGRVDTICFDKTGTLTENRLQVVRLVPLGPDAEEDELLRLAAAAAGTEDERAHETDRAVLETAEQHGVLPEERPERALPFAASRGFSAALRCGRLTVKGAPEVILGRCTDTDAAGEVVRDLAGQGLRVLAVADRSVDDSTADLEQAAQELTLRGLVALADTIRPSATAAVRQLRAAGVRVLVVTGDHPQTASAIAAQAGVPDAERVVTGAQLARTSEAERVRLVREAVIFARLSPEQKVSVIAALRRAGATLAMTGDGVNDAAAIRLADVGIAVSGAQSPAARSSADLVLTDVDLTRLVDAIAEGRAMWWGVRNAVTALVGGNAGEVAFTIVGTALGGRAPLSTRQLLLVNLLTDLFPALAVAVAAPRQAPHGARGASEAPSEPLAGHPSEAVLLAGPHRDFRSSVRKMMLVRGAATAAAATGAWAVGWTTGPRRRANTMGLATLITTQLGQTAWSSRRSPLVLVTVAATAAALLAIVQTPGNSRFFGCTPLDPLSWLVVFVCAVGGAVAAELVPALVTRWRARHCPNPGSESRDPRTCPSARQRRSDGDTGPVHRAS